MLIPAKLVNAENSLEVNESGTSAGRTDVVGISNCLAICNPKSLAPIAGTGKPPVAMIR